MFQHLNRFLFLRPSLLLLPGAVATPTLLPCFLACLWIAQCWKDTSGWMSMCPHWSRIMDEQEPSYLTIPRWIFVFPCLPQSSLCWKFHFAMGALSQTHGHQNTTCFGDLGMILTSFCYKRCLYILLSSWRCRQQRGYLGNNWSAKVTCVPGMDSRWITSKKIPTGATRFLWRLWTVRLLWQSNHMWGLLIF